MKKVGLVLSGGSAYGFAHIGVLEVLLKNKIPNQKDRKNKLYDILKDDKVNMLLEESKLDEAKVYVEGLIENI